METGFLNKHDSEYFSIDGYEQSNGFESENSMFNVFTIDYVDRTPEWIIPDEVPQKQTYNEDYRKTFEDWQQHISSLQSRDEALKDPLLSPIPEDLPDIFGTIPIDKIKGEPYMQDENLIDFPNIEIMSENHAIEHKSPTTNKEMTNTQSDLQLRQIDKNLNESNKLLLNNICIEQDLSQSNSENSNETMASPDLNVNSIKREPINEELSYQSAASSGHEMPVLSPELDVVQPKLEEYTSVNPPFLEISGHEFRKEKKMDIKMFTTDLGPDNYDVVEIKVEPDDDDVTNNIETVRETKPAIEAHNLDTLLEQFEASEALLNNNNKPMVEKFNKNKKANISTYNKQISYVPNNKYVPTNQNKTIKDALPREVIERIKDSSTRKKGISVVPPARLPAKGFNHMKDPGATKNKLLKLTSAKRGETVKLDHDYCHDRGNNGGIGDNGSRSAASSSASAAMNTTSSPSLSDHSSKKDSGLESGDVKPGESLLIKNHIKQNANTKDADTGVLINSETLNNSSTVPSESPDNNNVKDESTEEPKKKKKLNLEEYRSRRKNIKSKPTSPTKLLANADVNGFRKQPDNVTPADSNPIPPAMNAEVQTVVTDEKKEVKKRDPSKDRRSSRPLQRYRRRSSSSSSSSSGSRSRSRWRSRERSGRRWSSKGRRPRSRTRSSSSARSLSSSSSLSRSRSRSRSSKYHYRSRTGYRRSNYGRHSRYSPERIQRRQDDWSPVEKMRQIEERRVIYVGQIEEGTTKSQLRERFETFGPIIDISLHFRERGDNYGFVTFAYKVDAYKAVEHGNDYPMEPQYDICFGGRRAFCKQRYSDLDGTSQCYTPYHQNSRSNDSFDVLLREAQEKIRKQKHV
ncbi:PGC-1 family member spargel isoform X2 [Rhodnius prolixus]|uniref:PGC-1 family member spargel isoform X2 n=1 Tax=Rhodnius prolixus TaxID=13249 RepID=UPI003D18D3E2